MPSIIGQIITDKMLGWAIAGCLALNGISFTTGYVIGTKTEKAGLIDEAEDQRERQDDNDKQFQEGVEDLEDTEDEHRAMVVVTDQAAVNEIRRLEGTIDELLWRLQNDKTTDPCEGVDIPQSWRMQHDRLDYLLQGISEAVSPGSDQDGSGVIGSKGLAGYPSSGQYPEPQ